MEHYETRQRKKEEEEEEGKECEIMLSASQVRVPLPPRPSSITRSDRVIGRKIKVRPAVDADFSFFFFASSLFLGVPKVGPKVGLMKRGGGRRLHSCLTDSRFSGHVS